MVMNHGESAAPAEENGARNLARARSMAALSDISSVSATSTRSRSRISDVVYDELSEAIRDLRLPPGAALSEPGVAASLGVSRAPVREAFTRLADQGLVTIRPQVGTTVAPIAMVEVNDAVFIRSALEQSAFQHAIRLEDLDVSELQGLVDRNRDAAARGDVEDFFQSDEELHQLVFAIAGVPRIWQVVRGAKIHLDRLRRLNVGGALANPEIPAEHQHIVDAIRLRDEPAGLTVIHRHSTRILGDTEKIRLEHPDYFTS